MAAHTCRSQTSSGFEVSEWLFRSACRVVDLQVVDIATNNIFAKIPSAGNALLIAKNITEY